MSFDPSDYAGLTNDTAIDPPEPPICSAEGCIEDYPLFRCEECGARCCFDHSIAFDVDFYDARTCLDCAPAVAKRNSRVREPLRTIINQFSGSPRGKEAA